MARSGKAERAGSPEPEAASRRSGEPRAAERPLRKQGEALLEARRAIDSERQRYLDLFQFAPDPYVVTDTHGTLREANRASAELMGTEPQRLIGKPLVVFVASEDRPAFRKLITEILRIGVVKDRRVDMLTRHAEVRTISMTAAATSGAPPSGIRWLLRDVTDRVHAEDALQRLTSELDDRVAERTAQLERALDAKDEFLGMISHELRTPLTTVAGNVEVLRRRYARLSDSERLELVADVEADANRLRKLIEDLLLLARAELSGDANGEPIAPARVATQVAEHSRRTLPCKIELRIEDDLPTVVGSQTYTEQVLRNLIGNAAKYSPDGVAIELAVRSDARGVAFVVSDRGQGIPAAELEMIFEPFYRSSITSQQIQGTGVGLAVCRRLIEAQGGEIWVRPRDGGGTEFGFSLPADGGEGDD